MNVNTLFDKIDALSDEYVLFWKEICDIESPTHNVEAVNKVGLAISNLAKNKGFSVDVKPIVGSGDVVTVTINKDVKAKPLTLSAHIDTVHSEGLFGYPPTKIENGIIYGPGVVDCKGGAVAALVAMDALNSLGFDKRPIRLILQTDEEVSSRQSNRETINYICESSKDSVAFLNLEGNRSDDNLGIARKGIITYNFDLKGEEAHSAECATHGANAILEAAHKIIELEKIKDADGVTINCSIIGGGTTVNTVPANCSFKANIRFASKEQLDWVGEYVQKIADTTFVEGCKTTLSVIGRRIMMEDCERNRNLAAIVNESLEKAGLATLKAEIKKGGSDAADVTAAGIPCVDNLGVVGGYIHSPKEWAEVSSLSLSAKRICAIAVNI